ncbi:MAG: DNA alkylation repair protein [Flavobacteriales bacterium]|nr:MAG: DNA alkylation repair protein [Flavobacteriales bacterium]
MSNLLKDIYSVPFYAQFSEVLSQTIPSFDKAEFKSLIFNDQFETYELKERMTHTAKILHHFLPTDFEHATHTIRRIIENLRDVGIKEEVIEYMFFPEYIAMYGIHEYESSISAFEFITQFTSCEFAVRPYILKYEEKMLTQLLLWSKHENKKVRRLASEGSRPRLPWAMALPNFKTDPKPILPILNNLKHDACEVVRRSVANNLNDISKDNPQIVVEIAKKWKGINTEIDSIVKHGCRTLLKQGNTEILKLFGFDSSHITLSNFKIITSKVSTGGELEFSFSVANKNESNRMVRLEYGLYYMKKNGQLSKKVFKISEREIKPNRTSKITKKHSFKPITTRKFYVGKHQLSIIVNGHENKTADFELTN